MEKPIETIDEYIATFPPGVRSVLKGLRQVIREAAPGAEETISNGMPAFRLNGILVYFAAQKNHIGFYPTPSGISAFRKELSPYGTSKGTVRFPLGEPMPFDLRRKIVQYRVKENLERATIPKK